MSVLFLIACISSGAMGAVSFADGEYVWGFIMAFLCMSNLVFFIEEPNA